MRPRNLKPSILKLLKVTHLLSTKEILEQLEGQGKTYNKTSAYRALDQLVAQGLVCQHYFSDGQALYEIKEHDHVHMVCSECGDVAAAECEYQQPQQLRDFRVDHHHVTLVGTCASCSRKRL